MALMAILAVGAVGGIASYNEHAALRRNNEHACTVYNAAQAAIARAKANGMLEELEEEVRKVQNEPEEEIRKAQNEPEEEIRKAQNEPIEEAQKVENVLAAGAGSNIKEAGAVPAEITGSDYPSLCYIMKCKGMEEGLLCDLLGETVPDEVLFGASVCIETDLHTGIVYSVCYSDRADCFSYDGSQGTDISQRKESARKAAGFGYYGEQYF